MSNLTAEQLVQRLSELRLIDRDELRALVTQYDPRTLASEELIDLLVRGELLTNYQADRLVKGEKQGFFYGKYKVLYLISQGSFARVYRTVEEGTGDTYAVKVLRRRFLQDRNIRERFRREGDLGRTLQHPNIVAVHDVYAKGTTYFLVMDFVEGQNLREFLNLRKKIAAPEATRLMKDITAGLFYAFTRGVAHRDLKLSNVLVSAQGRAKLIDFGLAGLDNEMGANEVQVNSDNVRTVDYAGLEKVTNVKRGDPRSDIFFAGCIYYHMLAGESAMIESKDQMKRMVKNRFTDIRPIQQLEPELPWVVTRVVNKALEISPSLRYQTPGEMLVDLATAIKALESGDARPAGKPAARETSAEPQAPAKTARPAAAEAPVKSTAPATKPAPAAKPAAASGQSTSKPTPAAGQTASAPRSNTPTREKTPAEKSSSSIRNAPTVLVVESDPNLQDKLREKLKKYGYRVLVISDLVRGMERAADEFSPVDAVVLNAGSLGRDAVTAFNSFDKKLQTMSIPALLLLSEKQGVWKKEVVSSPQRVVLAMPFRMKEFVEAIRGLVSPDAEALRPGTVDALSRQDPSSRDGGSKDGKSKDGRTKDGKSKDGAGAPSTKQDEPSVTMATEGMDIAAAMAAQTSISEAASMSASLFGDHLHAMSAAPTPAPDGSREGGLTTLHTQRGSQAGSKPGSKPGSKGAGSKAGSHGEPPSGVAPPPLVPSGDNMGMVDNYELREELGQGGMGTVYRAVHNRLKREVAIKILSPDRVSSKRAVKRFEREIKLVARLDHPNIVRAHDAGDSNGRYYLVMEYIKGIDLSDLVKKCGPLPVADACELIRQSAVGLQHAHEHHMVHRDIKPSNLVLDGKNAVVKILDLGLALLRTDAGAPGEELTGSGQVLGTVEYMAPEQWSDTHTVDIRADIYSLGCTMYRLLTGAPPFHGAAYANMLQKMMAHAQAPPPPLTEKRSDISPELWKVVERMLAKSPGDRFAQPMDVAVALAPFSKGANIFALLEKAASVPDSDSKEGSSSRYL